MIEWKLLYMALICCLISQSLGAVYSFEEWKNNEIKFTHAPVMAWDVDDEVFSSTRSGADLFIKGMIAGMSEDLDNSNVCIL